MTTIKEKYLEQKSELDEFARLARNYDKDGPIRKSKDYLLQRRETFNSIFQRISQNHQVLLLHKDGNQDYFKKNNFETIEKLCKALRKDIESRLAYIAEHGEDDDNIDLDTTIRENPSNMDSGEKTFTPSFIDASGLDDDESSTSTSTSKVNYLNH